MKRLLSNSVSAYAARHLWPLNRECVLIVNASCDTISRDFFSVSYEGPLELNRILQQSRGTKDTIGTNVL